MTSSSLYSTDYAGVDLFKFVARYVVNKSTV